MMSSNRIVSFDFIRVLSIIGILICHSCNKFPEYDWFGFFCACTFNFLFLILSAFLMGMSWRNRGQKTMGISFLRSRLIKLSSSYYPFLIFLFLLLYFHGTHIDPHKYITHILFLPWFDKIGGFHHLWYMTLIVICYVSIIFLSKIFEYICLDMCKLIIIGGGYFIDIQCVISNGGASVIFSIICICLSFGILLF